MAKFSNFKQLILIFTNPKYQQLMGLNLMLFHLVKFK